jgi:hypothetical protein
MLANISSRDSERVQKWKQALLIAIKKHDIREEARICNVLGHVFEQEEHQWRTALLYHQRDLELSIKAHDMKGCGIAHRNLGECYVE